MAFLTMEAHRDVSVGHLRDEGARAAAARRTCGPRYFKRVTSMRKARLMDLRGPAFP
jgi:hypothetical protein